MADKQAKGALDKTPRTRSPSFPIFGIEEAIRRIGQIHGEIHDHKVSVEAIAEALGTNTKSSAFLQSMSTLLQFGLLEDEGRGGERRIGLSHLANDILVWEENSRERIAAIKQAALTPPVHREIWSYYKGKMPPSDSAIRVYLQRERQGIKFHPEPR